MMMNGHHHTCRCHLLGARDAYAFEPRVSFFFVFSQWLLTCSLCMELQQGWRTATTHWELETHMRLKPRVCIIFFTFYFFGSLIDCLHSLHLWIKLALLIFLATALQIRGKMLTHGRYNSQFGWSSLACYIILQCCISNKNINCLFFSHVVSDWLEITTGSYGLLYWLQQYYSRLWQYYSRLFLQYDFLTTNFIGYKKTLCRLQ